MKTLHLLAAGNTGGIENLCKDYAKYSNNENIFVFVWRAGLVAEQMQQQGANVVTLNLKKKELIKLYSVLCEICKKENVDTLVVHHDSPAIHLVAMLMHKKGFHVISYAHSNAEDLRGGKNRKFDAAKQFILKRAFIKSDKVVAISESVKDSLVKLFHIPEEKITVVYNGVDVARFTSVERNTEKREKVEIIYVGRLIEQKGVQVTLKALSMISDDINYRFRIVGNGPYKEKLVEYANELQLDDKVEFLGNRTDVPQLLADSDIYIHMPVWQEGFGISVIEALSTGIICVCAQSGAIPEIITHGEDGYLVPQNNADELANTLKSVCQKIDSEENILIGKRAVKKAEQFSIEIFAENLDQLINSCK